MDQFEQWVRQKIDEKTKKLVAASGASINSPAWIGNRAELSILLVVLEKYLTMNKTNMREDGSTDQYKVKKS